MKRLPIALVASILALFSFASARGERVGYGFTGALQVGSSGTTTIFNVSVAKNAPITGTFSYDTAAWDGSSSAQTFNQSISAGYTLNVDNGKLRLSASDFRIVVTNDYQRQTPVETDDIFDIKFDSRFTPTPSSLLVNDVLWTGPTAYMTTELSWPSSAFADPELSSGKPGIPGISTAVFSLLGNSASSPKLFNITSVSPIATLTGDYNCDGIVDANDYTEWRRGFGGTDPAYLYADGDHDGVVDASDYVNWRRQITMGSGASAVSTSVPEPTGFSFLVAVLFPLASRWPRANKCLP